MTKEKIEYYLYNFDYFQDELSELEMAILELVEKKTYEYEKYPQLSLDKIRVQGGQQNAVMNSVIKIIDKFDRQINILRATIDDKYSEFTKIKDALPKLTKEEFALVVAKYFKHYKGERLYKELNYAKQGYYTAQARTLAKLRRLV